jgi:hypothetical protein
MLEEYARSGTVSVATVLLRSVATERKRTLEVATASVAVHIYA